MRLLLLFLFASALHAQSPLRNDDSDFDACPDPKKYHIASRTVHTSSTDNNGPSDTLREYFNRKGFIIAQEFYYAPSEGGKADTVVHYFTYDKKGRILCDSDFSYQHVFLTTYEYSTDGKRVVVHNPPWRGDTMTRMVRYDNHGDIISDCTYSDNGDLLYETVVRGDTTITINRHRQYTDPSGTALTPPADAKGTLITIDSTVCIHKAGVITTFTALVAEQATMQEDILMDHKNRITDKRTYLDSVLRESYHYTYDRKGKLISFTDTIFPLQHDEPGNTIWHMKYFYDNRGRLIRDENWSKNHPETIYITNYIYNERGLLIRQQTIREKSGKQEREYNEVWEYSYYGR